MDAQAMKILAPVGGYEQLLAAVRAGADAVYLGAKGFNARRNAENFGDTSLESAVRYCHEHGVSVYVTVNTLVMDDEFPALVETVDEIAAAGADAVIAQDLAVVRLIRARYPSLPIHGSTQMTVHNIEGVRALEELGCAQVVLARELSAREIQSIRAATNMELEAFVHGALCMCVSGACYLSGMLGGRSGNRGLCAQPCRTNFRLEDREYALSLKDLSLIERIGELRDAGVTSLKIEGRMKRPEYVYAAVTACRRALHGETPDMETLEAVFSRNGFTDGYFTGRRDRSMFGYRTKDDVRRAAEVLPSLARMYDAEKQTIPVDMRLTVRAGQPATVSATDGTHTVEAVGAVAEPARNVPLDGESARKNLAQTGGTPYCLRAWTADIDGGLALSVSAIKQLRRDALGKLSALRGQPVYHERGAYAPVVPPVVPRGHDCTLRLRFERAAQMFDAPSCQIVLPVSEIDAELVARLGERLIAETPAVVFPDDMPQLRARLMRLIDMGVRDVLVNNIGTLGLARELGLCAHGDTGLNILNGIALEEYARLGLTDATVSFELSMKKIRALGGSLPRGIIGYGYLPLMRMRACPARGEHGCGDCTGKRTLTDAKRETFTLLCHEKRYAELCNSVPLYIGDKAYGDVDFVTLRFTTETRAEAERVTRMFEARETPDFRRTNGLYFRELL